MLTTTLENLLNRGLPRSPRARQLCAELAGKSLAITVRDITRLRIVASGSTLAVAASAEPADASLSGGPAGLLALLGPSPEAAVQRGEVELSGDTEISQQFRELLKLLRPDPEEELSLLVGDVPAHQFGRLASGAFAFGRRLATTAVTNAAEYFAHERADLVPRAEGEQFLRGVDALRESVDRLQARLDLLARRRSAP
jgi:ubiquinone biosynthesis protein UbiJ